MTGGQEEPHWLLCLEERGLYQDLKLEPTLVYLATLKGMNESEARRRIADWLKRL